MCRRYSFAIARSVQMAEHPTWVWSNKQLLLFETIDVEEYGKRRKSRSHCEHCQQAEVCSGHCSSRMRVDYSLIHVHALF